MMKFSLRTRLILCACSIVLMQLLLCLGVTFVNPFFLVITLLPLLTIALSVVLILLVKNLWMVTGVFAISFILGMFIFFNPTFWVWSLGYTLLSLATCVLVGLFTRRHT